MDGDRGLSLLAHPDQWARCHHRYTALLPGGGVQLSWDDDPEASEPGSLARPVGPAEPLGPVEPGGPADPLGPVEPGGLAFDRWCRAYRCDPRAGYVTVHRAAAPAPAATATAGPARAPTTPSPAGDGILVPAPMLRRPRGLAVDSAQRLYIAESGTGSVYVVDLWTERLLRRVPVHVPGRRGQPVDVAAYRCGAVVLLRRPAALVELRGRAGPRPGPPLLPPRCRGPLAPHRVAAGPDGEVFVLWRQPDGARAIIAAPDGTVLLDASPELAGATDVEVTGSGTLVVARAPGRSFLRFVRHGSGWLELEPVAADSYDGGAVAVAPDGAVAFTTRTAGRGGTGRAAGTGHAAGTGGIGWTGGFGARYRTTGRVVTYRLDSGAYRTRWGRLFVDARIPAGTGVRVRFLSGDDDQTRDPLDASPPEHGGGAVRRPDLTPPLPSQAALEQMYTGPADTADTAGASAPVALLRRPTGRERPWAQIAADDRFETYEAPVLAAPGRYLWVVFELSGSSRATPRVRSMRVERPGHRLLDHLPRLWSRDPSDADFLQRFLAPAEGILHELDERAASRSLLLDPAVAPQEALAWLASFAGLVLDRRWPESARRTLVAEAFGLFRRRGTLPMLSRILEIYLGYPPVLVEQWRLRGLGGAVLGDDPTAPAAAVVGAGIRTGGTVGGLTLGGPTVGEDGFRTSAHRFTVLIPADLSAAQLDVVRAILDAHRPAHTVADICELGYGMRVGRRLHVGLTSVVGPGASWGPAVVGQVAVGGDGVVGTPAVGARLGTDSTVGRVRVG